jgi:hypothetical protein
MFRVIYIFPHKLTHLFNLFKNIQHHSIDVEQLFWHIHNYLIPKSSMFYYMHQDLCITLFYINQHFMYNFSQITFFYHPTFHEHRLTLSLTYLDIETQHLS